ncbi:MAG: glycosyltransferase [Actinomyces sp.]|uniref:glycosyltransferase n=1 Tax=Actinomyces sp. TaxID=29317 RepID=UPI0026DD65C0|nr:glycosyltransferase [Actinomyces sp.]MDO4244080.1 glycosyltransferase [Actinomyces sp.]
MGDRLRRGAAAEDGQTLLLGLGLVTLVVGLVLVISSATAVYLDLKNLTSLADSAAAAAADAVDDPTYFGGQATSGTGMLSDAGVLVLAERDLRSQPVDLAGVTIVSATALDGRTAVVTLSARSRPPFLPWGIIPSEGFMITATGSARVATTQ